MFVVKGDVGEELLQAGSGGWTCVTVVLALFVAEEGDSEELL